MSAELISVGTELLMGNIVNTNAQYISQRLADLGIDSYLQTTVGDNHDRLVEAVHGALRRADIVILTGGLGPTADDLTKETVSDAFGKKLVLDEASLEYIKARFAKRGHEMTPNNVKQAYFPEGCIILPNPNGTAPGCIVETEAKAAILMPGPPNEMVPMFEASVLPYLEKRSGYMLKSKMLRIFGKGESSVEYELKDIMASQTNPTIAPYALNGEMKLRVTARCRAVEDADAIMAPMIAEVKRRIGEYIYSEDGLELHEEVARLFVQKGLTLAVAESCTGGMICSKLVSVPGSSAWFKEGCVTYSNESKMHRLGVKQATLDEYDAVSAQTAAEMAEGIRTSSGADIGVATTGFAGPDGGTEDNPVGTVYIGFSSKDKSFTKRLQLTGSRERIRSMASLHALDILRRNIL